MDLYYGAVVLTVVCTGTVVAVGIKSIEKEEGIDFAISPENLRKSFFHIW